MYLCEGVELNQLASVRANYGLCKERILPSGLRKSSGSFYKLNNFHTDPEPWS